MRTVRFVLIGIVLVIVALVRRGRATRARGVAQRSAHSPWQVASGFSLRRWRFGTIGLIAGREWRERTHGRIYRVGTIIMLLIVAAAVVIPTLRSKTSPLQVGTVGGGPAVQSAISTTASELKISAHTVSEPTLAAATSALRRGTLDVVLNGESKVLLLDALSSGKNSTAEQFARAVAAKLSVLATIRSAGLSPTQAATLAHPIAVPITGLRPAPPSGARQGTSIIGLVLLFVLLSQYSAWILIGVSEEKSSRVVEVLLATVRPIQLLAGKVTGIGLAALAQATVLIAAALVLARAVGSSVVSGTTPLELASLFLWLVLGYSFYCWVYAAAGSLAERQDQLQSLTFPLSVPMIFGYIVSLTAAASSNPSALVVVLGYLPPTAPFAMPVLVGLGKVTWWEFALSGAISVLATIAIAQLAAGIYRRAILRTGRRVKLRELFDRKNHNGPLPPAMREAAGPR